MDFKSTNMLTFSRAMAAVLVCCFVSNSCYAQIVGFTEPFRSVVVAAPESGIVKDINSRVGQRVAKGQIVASLDSSIHELLLESATARMNSKGKRMAAVAQLGLREVRVQKLQQIIDKGHGRIEELIKAKSERDIAVAKLQEVEDELTLARLEHKRLSVQQKRFQIGSPLDGFVAETHKEPGEFVSQSNPNILTIVQLDPLVAKFSLPADLAGGLQVGQEAQVRFSDSQTTRLLGRVVQISPTVSAQNNTVDIRVGIDNPANRFQSGRRCVLLLGNGALSSSENAKSISDDRSLQP